MPHLIESARSGRAKCRGCGRQIKKGEMRCGERRENIFGEGEMTLWLHLTCAAYKRPEVILEVLNADINQAELLRSAASFSIAHPRLTRIGAAGLAPTGRARCRHCRDLIKKGTWRIGLVFFEEFRFEPSGFIHATCARDYFGTAKLMERIECFSAALGEDDRNALEMALKAQ